MEQEEKTYHWFLFYKDRLLLRKTAGRYEIPYGDEVPLAIDHALRVVSGGGDARAHSRNRSEQAYQGGYRREYFQEHDAPVNARHQLHSKARELCLGVARQIALSGKFLKRGAKEHV